MRPKVGKRYRIEYVDDETPSCNFSEIAECYSIDEYGRDDKNGSYHEFLLPDKESIDPTSLPPELYHDVIALFRDQDIIEEIKDAKK